LKYVRDRDTECECEPDHDRDCDCVHDLERDIDHVHNRDRDSDLGHDCDPITIIDNIILNSPLEIYI